LMEIIRFVVIIIIVVIVIVATIIIEIQNVNEILKPSNCNLTIQRMRHAPENPNRDNKHHNLVDFCGYTLI